MKKTMLCCLALSVCVSASAQSGVTVSGLVDIYAGSFRNAGDAGRTNLLGSGGMTTSYLGFSGVEDLGGGLRAVFGLSSFLRADTGSAARYDGDTFFSREANVGLAGSFGSVRLGRGLAPNFLPSATVNPFGGSFSFSPLILHQNINTTKYTYRTTPSDTGWSNEIVYSTPSWNGLQGNVHYQFGEQSSSSGLGDKHNIGGNAMYGSGPLTLVAYYEYDQVTNPSPVAITTTVDSVAVPATRKVWMVGGAYDAGAIKGFATYGRSTQEITNYDARTTSLGVSAPVGASKLGAILAGIARSEVSGPFNGNRVTASLGYDYFLSKRTDLYAMAMRDRVSGLQSGNSVGFGIRHRF